jgi:putative intracellular protease/amidase
MAKAKKVVDTTDGVAYTRAQFVEFYGEKKANKIWEKATGEKAAPSPKAKAKAKVKAKAKAKAPKPTPKIELKANTVVLVSTSAAFLKGHPTGVWLEELAAPYYKFKAAGFEVVIASPRGGPIPIDANSIKGDFFTAEAKKFMHDGDAFDALAHSVRLSAIDWESAEVKAVFMCGGHGVEVDFVRSGVLKQAIETLHGSERVVAAVCHGPVCLAQCKKADGSPLVKGLEVTGFSNSEEAAVGLGDKCAWLIEDKFKELEGVYTAAADWTSNVKVAGKLVTGQNPQSSVACAEAVIKLLA